MANEVNDQAASLRKMQPDDDRKNQIQSKKAVCCIAVASGKGGVGKTFLSVNLAIALSRFNKKVLLVDADLGLANADIILGLHPEFSMQDAIFKGKPLSEVVISSKYGIDLIAASSGSKEMVSLGAARMNMFLKDLVSFAAEYDVLIFDCAAGIDSTVMSFIAATPQTIIVATSQPTSIMDVYALMKLIHQDNLTENMGLIVNMVNSEEEGMKVAGTLNMVAEKYLSRSVNLLGIIPFSENVSKTLQSRTPIVVKYEEDAVSRKIREIAKSILYRQNGSGVLNTEKLLNGFLNI